MNNGNPPKTTMSAFPRLCATALCLAALAGCAGSRTSESTGEIVDDSAVTARVKTALLRTKGISSTDIKVETFKGRVQLSGFVRTSDEKKLAEETASSTSGVRGVVDSLEVR